MTDHWSDAQIDAAEARGRDALANERRGLWPALGSAGRGPLRPGVDGRIVRHQGTDARTGAAGRERDIARQGGGAGQWGEGRATDEGGVIASFACPSGLFRTRKWSVKLEKPPGAELSSARYDRIGVDAAQPIRFKLRNREAASFIGSPETFF